MNQLGTVYATKRRRRNGKSLKPSPKETTGKSNPSKRHRERLNAELDTLASLLPFEASILSKLDRLSILRLSVSYLRTKSYFQVSMHKGKEMGHIHDSFRSRDLGVYEASTASLDGECFLQALNGFLVILSSEGEVFFATHSIESYLGFHQSDVVHQSVYELVHSEDREELQRQLSWNNQVPAESGLSVLDALRTDHCHHLERSFTVRFRCLLDNTSGFLRLDVRGKIKVLHGQNTKSEEPPLALFALCTPFGPPSLLELPHKDTMFKSKHRLDLALVSMDQRGKSLLGYTDTEMSTMGGYDLVHYDDLAYVASAHQELLKTGASGLIAYRLQAKEGQWQWLQTSSRLVYKNSKPDFIISTHRPLMEEEGRDLLGKRTMDFKVSYLDAGLASSYLMDQEVALQSQRLGRRYKSQLRDFLTTCRTKRKVGTPEYLPETPAWTPTAAAAAAAAAYPAGVYPTSMAASPAAYSGENPGLYMHHQQNMQTLPNLQNHLPTFYPALDNRFLSTDNLFHGYRGLAGVGGCGYYPTEYSPYVHHATTGNGFLPPGYEASVGVGVPQLYTSPGPSSGDTSKYNPVGGGGGMSRLSVETTMESVGSEDCGNGSVDSHSYHRLSRATLRKAAGEHGNPVNGLLPKSNASTPGSTGGVPGQDKNGVPIAVPTVSGDSRSNSSSNESTGGGGGAVAINNAQQQGSYTTNNDTRQTVLMWGAGGVGAPNHPDSSASVVTTLISDPTVSVANHHGGYSAIPSQNNQDSLHEAKKYHQHHHPHHAHHPHGAGVGIGSTNGCTTPHSSLKAGLDLNLSNACKWSRMGSTSPPRVPTALTSHYLYGEAGSEVWPHHQYYSYPSYHHHHHAPHPAVDPHNSSYPSIGRSGVLCCPSPR